MKNDTKFPPQVNLDIPLDFVVDSDKERELYAIQMSQVVKSNQLIRQARHDLTIKQMKLIDMMIARVQKDDKGFFVMNTSIKEINSILGITKSGQSYDDTKKALKSLANKSFWWSYQENGAKTESLMRWLDTAKVNEFGEVQLKLHNELAPHLLGLKREYTQFNFLNVVNMTSKYEVALYEFLHSYYNMTGVPDIPVEEMRSLFGMDDEEKYPWFRVQDKIKKAISGIERKTTMLITMETIKRGRKVVKLRFFLTSQETQQMLEVKQNGND